jgi:hypothetical protein
MSYLFITNNNVNLNMITSSSLFLQELDNVNEYQEI